MPIDAEELIGVLQSKNVEYLYHANTTKTALSFIRNAGLLSRGAVDILGEVQTPQYTDDADKRFGVWNDIFFDAVDIHERIRNNNKYGPVLFVYNLEVLKTAKEDGLRIVKLNPSSWNDNTTEEQKFYTDINDFDLHYCRGDFNTQITFNNFTTPLLFACGLEKIIVDTVRIKYRDIHVGTNMLKAIRDAVVEHSPDELSKICIRSCPIDCKCHQTYLDMYNPKFERLLFP